MTLKICHDLQPIRVVDAHMPEFANEARGLFVEYSSWLTVDLESQGFAAELAGLRGHYAPPLGALLLAKHGGASVGCVALRPLTVGVGEVKRLWVKPSHRKLGAGRILVESIIQRARAAGYLRLRLDTLAHMNAARQLYGYYANPLPDTVYLATNLRD